MIQPIQYNDASIIVYDGIICMYSTIKPLLTKQDGGFTPINFGLRLANEDEVKRYNERR